MGKKRYLVTIISDFISGEYDYALDEDGNNRTNFDRNRYMVVNGRGFKIRSESCGPNQVTYLGRNRVELIPLHKIPVHKHSPSTSIVTHWFEYNGLTHDSEGRELDTALLLVLRYSINIYLEEVKDVWLRRLPN